MSDSHHVLPNATGGWDIRRSNGERASHHTETKQAAVDIARIISRNQGTELVIHGTNGKIQVKDSHGRDPHPPNG